MPEGKCVNCGKKWFGWALLYGDNKCTCGERIIIEEDIPDTKIKNNINKKE
jgi:DNA-directed RNA polymerase subunit RPC12/RpoP